MINLNAQTFGTVAAKQPVISEGVATRTLNETESGSVCLFDRAAGIIYTLPAACAVGTYFDFVTAVTITGGAAKIITGAGTELMVGAILNCDTDSSDAVAIWKSLVATGNVAVSMNGTTTGGIIGDWIRVVKVTSTKWQVTGTTLGTSTVATPFAAS
jgi:hypothetical protein